MAILPCLMGTVALWLLGAAVWQRALCVIRRPESGPAGAGAPSPERSESGIPDCKSAHTQASRYSRARPRSGASLALPMQRGSNRSTMDRGVVTCLPNAPINRSASHASAGLASWPECPPRADVECLRPGGSRVGTRCPYRKRRSSRSNLPELWGASPPLRETRARRRSPTGLPDVTCGLAFWRCDEIRFVFAGVNLAGPAGYVLTRFTQPSTPGDHPTLRAGRAPDRPYG